jgi:hypothetical protein
MDRFSPHDRLVRRQLPGARAAARRRLGRRWWRVVAVTLGDLESGGGWLCAPAEDATRRLRDLRILEGRRERIEGLLRSRLGMDGPRR